MSQKEMERFADAVRTDKGLQEGIKKAATSNDAIVEFANSRGYDVSVDEMVAYVQAKKATLTKEDLEKVAGGKGNIQAEHTSVRVDISAFGVEVQDVFTSADVMLEAEGVIVIIAT